jgi:hypothetical protein
MRIAQDLTNPSVFKHKSTQSLNKMKLISYRGGLAVSFAALSFVAGGATFTPVSLPTLDTDIRTFTDGSAYNPLFPSSSPTFAGVPFSLNADAGGNTAFIGLGKGGPSLTIPANVFGASSVFTLINTAFGSQGSDVGSLTFNGSLGDTYTVQLIEGGNVRDHYYGSFVNTTTDPTTQQAVFGINSPGHAHLDMQDFLLPSVFGTETLKNIVFTSNLLGGNGEPFIVGATVLSDVSDVPDAGFSAGLLGLSLGALSLVRHRFTH